MDRITMRSPDDGHYHPRDWLLMSTIINFTSTVFHRALVKGNLSRNGKPEPVYRADQMLAWCQRIVAASHFPFTPVPTIMMVKQTTPNIVKEARQAGATALCLIPEGTSTNSEFGVAVADLRRYYPILGWMERAGMVFSVHPELNVDPRTGEVIPEKDRERRFLPFLAGLAVDFPGLTIVAEHLSTKEGVDMVRELPKNVFATLTPHHMVLTVDDVLNPDGSIKNPDNYCKPIAKTEKDRRAVVGAAVSGNSKFFFGSDSAAHWAWQKRKTNPNAGVWSAPILMPRLASIFEGESRLDRLENFTSRYFAKCYSLPLNKGHITLAKEAWKVPCEYEGVNLFQGGKTLNWRVL